MGVAVTETLGNSVTASWAQELELIKRQARVTANGLSIQPR